MASFYDSLAGRLKPPVLPRDISDDAFNPTTSNSFLHPRSVLQFAAQRSSSKPDEPALSFQATSGDDGPFTLRAFTSLPEKLSVQFSGMRPHTQHTFSAKAIL